MSARSTEPDPAQAAGAGTPRELKNRAVSLVLRLFLWIGLPVFAGGRVGTGDWLPQPLLPQPIAPSNYTHGIPKFGPLHHGLLGMRVLSLKTRSGSRTTFAASRCASVAVLAVDCAENGVDGAALTEYRNYDLLLLDLMLPGLDGLSIVRQVAPARDMTPFLSSLPATSVRRWSNC